MFDFFSLFGVAFVFFVVGGWLLKRIGVFREDSTGRYFVLHVVCNGFVTVVHMDDVWLTYKNPLTAPFNMPTDIQGTAVIAALHCYHLVVYTRELQAVDWAHHLIMIVVMLPLAVGLNAGSLLGHGAFFASGLPGGLDYLMLVLVKARVMESMTEKKWNTVIQTWVRAPGCLFHALFVWLALRDETLHQWVLNHSYLPPWGVYFACFVVMTTYYWNAMYFQQRVAQNYAVRQSIESNKSK